jgi:hypothetical protein
MKHILLLCAIFVLQYAKGATGDLLSATVETNGWVLQLKFASMNTNGVINNGFATNNNPTTPGIKLYATSPGYTAAGSSTTVSRVLYGTKVLRLPYPNTTIVDTTASGSDVIVRVALSEWIYPNDTNLKVDVLSGTYVASSISNNLVTNFTVSNISTQAYARVVANWSWPDKSLITGTSYKLRATAFHRHGTGGNPVPLVRFFLTDGATTNSIDATAVVKSELPDAVQVLEYTGNVSTAGLNDGAVTAHFHAYPTIGTVSEILATTDGVNATGPLYAPQSYYLVKSGTIPGSVAVVSPSGVDASGAVVSIGGFSTNSPPSAYLTIAKAASAISAYNLANFSRNDNALSIIYLQSGAYAWSGASPPAGYGSTANYWLTITPYPGIAQSAVSISSTTGNSATGKKLLFKNINFSLSSALVIDGASEMAWFDQCTINHTGTSGAQFFGGTGTGMWYMTDCTVTALPQGLRPFSTQNMPLAITRGNGLSDFAGGFVPYTALGNKRTNSVSYTNTMQLFTEITGSTAPTPEGYIVAYNKLLGLDVSANNAISLRKTAAQLHGMVFAQNIVEAQMSSSGPLGLLAGDSHTASPLVNSIFIYNTLVGQRFNWFYNDHSPGGAQYRVLSRAHGNFISNINIKTDDFTGSGGGAGDRIGNWSDYHGVGHDGNFLPENVGIGSSGQFIPRFTGMKTYQMQSVGSPVNSIAFNKFVTYGAYDGAAAGSGNGDYRLQSDAPAMTFGQVGDVLLPYDIDGRPRSTTSPAGAYAEEYTPPSVPKFFFIGVK